MQHLRKERSIHLEEDTANKIYKFHIADQRNITCIGGLILGITFVISSIFLYEKTLASLLVIYLFGVFFIIICWLNLILGVDEVTIGLKCLTIRRGRKLISIPNENISGIRIWDAGTKSPLSYMLIKTRNKGEIPLRKRLHIFGYYSYNYHFLPLKKDLLALYGGQEYSPPKAFKGEGGKQ